jgi:hypothetical protein
MIGQNICTYNKYTNQVFDTPEDIDNWIEKLFFKPDSLDRTVELITRNRKIVDGNEHSSGYWLEKNLKNYYDLYSIPQKAVAINI